MLTFRHITLSRGTKRLLNDASAAVYEKQKIGLVGLNGCGKSSLFSLILGQLTTDAGDIQLNSNLRITHLSQEIPDSSQSALAFVLSGDDAYQALQDRLTRAEQAGDDHTVLACHDLLSQTGGYSKPAEAASILAGLGFSTQEQSEPVNHFSGGWRMRLSLARCLMKPADLMLLDEPTNHLDMEAIFWLEKWLKQSPASILVISHDREFLDAFITHILHIEQQTLTLYTGDYSTFEAARAEKIALQQASFEKQQKKINHLMSFVNRFKAKATKAKQAQSRLKAIDKMTIVLQANIDSPFSFEFFPSPRVSNPMINCEDLSAGYLGAPPILKHIPFILNPGDRIALLGPNGQGKSTLIKTLTGVIPPLSGHIHRSTNLTIGYYAQHQLEQLDCQLSPIETIQRLSPDAREQSIRNYLGGFNFIGDMATGSIKHFSGGEKARLALAKLVWLKPNLLLLDEPTNHLDLEMRAAIEIALQRYEGALVLISHDRHLLRTSVDQFYLVFDQKVQPFSGDLEDYHDWLQKKPIINKAPPSAKPLIHHREKKILQNQLKKLEALTVELNKKIASMEEKLADKALYETSQHEVLQALLIERDKLHQELITTETTWLDVMDALGS